MNSKKPYRFFGFLPCLIFFAFCWDSVTRYTHTHATHKHTHKYFFPLLICRKVWGFGL